MSFCAGLVRHHIGQEVVSVCAGPVRHHLGQRMLCLSVLGL